LSFPALCIVLLLFVHATVEFSPRTLREHRVTYRPTQTRAADWLLIFRLASAIFQNKPVPAGVPVAIDALSRRIVPPITEPSGRVTVPSTFMGRPT
jgi:hypothetical protein